MGWPDAFRDVVQIYQSAYRKEAYWLHKQATFNWQHGVIDANLKSKLIEAHCLPMETTLELIGKYYPDQLDSEKKESAKKTLMDCIKTAEAEHEWPKWAISESPSQFFNRMRYVMCYVASANDRFMRGLFMVEQCWIKTYLNYPHGLFLGRNQSDKLLKLLLATATERSTMIANAHAPVPPAPPPPQVTAAPAAAAAAAAPDQKTMYPTFQAAVSVFGRPVVPIGFPTPKALTGGTQRRFRASLAPISLAPTSLAPTNAPLVGLARTNVQRMGRMCGGLARTNVPRTNLPWQRRGRLRGGLALIESECLSCDQFMKRRSQNRPFKESEFIMLNGYLNNCQKCLNDQQSMLKDMQAIGGYTASELAPKQKAIANIKRFMALGVQERDRLQSSLTSKRANVISATQSIGYHPFVGQTNYQGRS
jgi:hypothetical protein